MVKKSKKSKEEPIEEIQIVETSEPESENESENIEFVNFLNEFRGSEYKIDVRKLSKDGSIWERVKTIPLDQFSPDLIAEVYGGGKYRFRVLDETGKFVKQFTCVYAEPIKKENENKVDKTDLTLQILLNQINSTNQMLIEMIRNYRPPEIKEQFKITDLLNLMTSIKQLYPSQNISEVLEFLKTGIELGQQVSGESTTFDKVLDLLTKIYSQRINLLNRTSMINKPVITKNGQEKNQVEIKQEMKEEIKQEVIVPKDELENKIFILFTPYKQLLLQCYNSSMPTGMVSLYLYNLCDDDVLEMIFEYFKNDENIERFSKFSGVAKEYIKSIITELKGYADNISEEQ